MFMNFYSLTMFLMKDLLRSLFMTTSHETGLFRLYSGIKKAQQIVFVSENRLQGERF